VRFFDSLQSLRMTELIKYGLIPSGTVRFFGSLQSLRMTGWWGCGSVCLDKVILNKVKNLFMPV
ncbi:MAG: hypothetical protein N4A43_03570, partial [Alphaproteobacteria bacterium]|nr:hypothetical protein [Alphaproteobacteria bacterium]